MKINKENTAKAIAKVKAIAAENKPIGEWTVNELHDYCKRIRLEYFIEPCKQCKICSFCNIDLGYKFPYEWEIGGKE